jgi:hypothetical protein
VRPEIAAQLVPPSVVLMAAPLPTAKPIALEGKQMALRSLVTPEARALHSAAAEQANKRERKATKSKTLLFTTGSILYPLSRKSKYDIM